MYKKYIRLFVICLAYGGLISSIVLYVIMNYVSSHYYGLGIRPLRPIIITSFILSLLALVSNIMIAVKYKNPLRVISIVGLLLSLAVAALLIVPLAFSSGTY